MSQRHNVKGDISKRLGARHSIEVIAHVNSGGIRAPGPAKIRPMVTLMFICLVRNHNSDYWFSKCHKQ